MNRKLRKNIRTLAGFYGLASGDPFLKSFISGKSMTEFQSSSGIDELMMEITQGGEAYYGMEKIQETISKSSVDIKKALLERLCFTLDNEKDKKNDDVPINKLDLKGFTEQGMGKPEGDFFTIDDMRTPAQEGNPGTKNINSDDEKGCKLHVVQVWKAGDTPSVANTDIVSIFCRAIPAIEMSKASPYIDIAIKLPFDPTAKEAPPLSINRFLVGGAEGSLRDVDKNLARATDAKTQVQSITAYENADDLDPDYKDPIGTVGGMEIFTSPQTMIGKTVNANTDKFRPFLSLESISLNEAPAGGLMSFKSGQLTLILHDRTRMSDVIPLIAPRSGKNARMEITYGWSHPDGTNVSRVSDSSVNNLFGKLIDSMKVTETYQVIQATHSMTSNGEINIEAQISLLASNSAATTPVTRSQISTAEEEINKLMQSISEFATNLQKRRKKIGKLENPKILSAAGNLGSAASFARKNSRSLAKKIKALRGNKSTKGIAGDIKTLFEEIKLLEASKEQIYNDMITTIKQSPDPFLKPGTGSYDSDKKQYKIREEQVHTPDKKNKKFKKQTYVSLGKLMSVFVGEAFAANEEVEEIQMMFYPFNESAAGCFHANIAQFPILISDLESIISNQIKVTSHITIGSFMSMINAFFLRDQGQHAYGIQHLFKSTRDKKDKKKRARFYKYKKNEIFTAKKTTALANIYGLAEDDPGIQFTIPQITLRYESGPRIMPDGKKNGDVLRIHVMDQACGKGAQLQELFQALSESGIMKELSRPEPEKQRNPGHSALIKDQMKALGKDGLDIVEEVKVKDSLRYYKIKPDRVNLSNNDFGFVDGQFFNFFDGSQLSLKELFMTMYPVIEYGTAGSNVVDASLSTQGDAALASIMMMRSKQSDADDDVGSDTGLPVQIMPTQLTLNILGCPYVSFGQQYFVDFGTGTTADNFYAVTGISHNIEAGNFRTSLNMINMMGFASFRSTLDKFRVANAQLEALEKETP